LQNGDGHVEMMVLHGRSGVDGGQRRAHVDHELVVEASMVQIVANGANKHGQRLAKKAISGN